MATLVDRLPPAFLASGKVKSAETLPNGDLSLNIVGGRNVLIAQDADGTYTVTTSKYSPGGGNSLTVTASTPRMLVAALRAEIKKQTGLEDGL